VEDGLVKVVVSDVRVAVATSPGVEAGLVTLQEEDPPNRTFQIIIGQTEARAIQQAWTGVAARRPTTWDLFVSTVALLEARLDRAVITAVEEGRHFYANLEFERGDERRVVGARPSDAIAVVLRAYGAAIYVAAQVFADLGMGEPPIDN
jgi:bifunctional DNase/RNase